MPQGFDTDAVACLSQSTWEVDAGVSLKNGEGWLLPRLPPASVNAIHVENLDTEARRVLPSFVLHLLLKHKQLVLAGGAALAVLCPGMMHSDYDLFVVGATNVEADAILSDILSHRHIRSLRTGNAVTMFLEETESSRYIQVVLRLYDSISSLLKGFDISPCKVAITSSRSNGCLDVYATQSCVQSIQTMSFWVNADAWSAASTSRYFKYIAKGFDVFVPGLRRSALAFVSNSRATNGGLISLFQVERGIMDQIYTQKSPHQRPDYDTIRYWVNRNNFWGQRYQSGYSERATWGWSMYYMLRALFRNGLVWFGLAPSRYEKNPIVCLWHQNPFAPRNPCIGMAYDLKEYAKLTSSLAFI